MNIDPNLIAAALKREADAAELARLQAEEAERQRLTAIEAQREREKAIARRAAEEATRLAEERAAQEAEAARIAAQRAQEAIERQASDALAKAKADKLKAIEAERRKAETERRAAQRAQYHRDMLAYVKSCGFGFIGPDPQPIGLCQYELEQKIKYNADNFGDLLPEAIAARDEALARLRASIDAENKRAKIVEADRQAREESELRERKSAARAADIEHRKAINREAMSGILSVLRQCGITEATLSTETGKALVTAIARNEILHVKLEY